MPVILIGASNVAAKLLTQAFHRRPPQRSYFVCSQGGHNALMEAQRFPGDYGGILAGAPVYSWIDEQPFQAWSALAISQIPGGALRKEKLNVPTQAVTKACAAVDGLIDDPRLRTLDPGAIERSGADSATCLTREEVVAVRKLYAGPKTLSGKQISSGLNKSLRPSSTRTIPIFPRSPGEEAN